MRCVTTPSAHVTTALAQLKAIKAQNDKMHTQNGAILGALVAVAPLVAIGTWASLVRAWLGSFAGCET